MTKMKEKAKNKRFDCVAMKRRGAAALQRRLAGMSDLQEAAYWRSRSVEFMAATGRREVKRIDRAKSCK